MEHLIFAATQLLEQMPDVLGEINERRYDAEREYERVYNEALIRFLDESPVVTRARAKAKLEAQPYLKTWQITKGEYHYAEATERALRTKINSYLNINRSVTAQFQTYRG